MARLPLRLRIFLFFALLGLGVVGILAGGLAFGALHADPAMPASGYITAGITAGFGALGLVVLIWLLFDENVAKPINRLSAELRTRAHSETSGAIDESAARYLGDLAPAAGAVAGTLKQLQARVDQAVSERTERMAAQTGRLTTLLSDVQVGLLLCSANHQLVFYNTPAVEMLRDTGRPQLASSLFGLLREGPVRHTYEYLVSNEGPEQDAELMVSTVSCGRIIAAHMRLVRGAGGADSKPGYVLTLRDVTADIKLHAGRERLLSETIDAIRAPAEGLRKLIVKEPLPPAIMQEADTLVTNITEICHRHDAGRDIWWPMSWVRTSHLIDGIRGQLGPEGPILDAPNPHILLRCDGYALVAMLTVLIEEVRARGLAEAFSLAVSVAATGADIRLSWDGGPLSPDDLSEILSIPIAETMSMTGREILEHHSTSLVLAAPDAAKSGLQLRLHEARLSIAPGALPPAQPIERPAVFDFDLLHLDQDAGLAGRKLTELTYVVFDTETTGLNPNGGDEIVQLAAVRLVNGKRVAGEEMNVLVDPERPIPPSSSAVHGVTDAMVTGAPTIREVGAAFHRFAANAVLVAHNAPFDMAFLHRHADAIGVRFEQPVFDTVLLSALLFGGAETHTLDALADRFGVVIPEEDRHTAYGDAVATAEVFQRLMPMLKARGLDTFEAVQAAMQKDSRLLREMNARVGGRR